MSGYENYREVAANRKDPETPEPAYAKRIHKQQLLDQLSSELAGTMETYERHDPEFLEDEQVDSLAICDIEELLKRAQKLGSLMGKYESKVSDE